MGHVKSFYPNRWDMDNLHPPSPLTSLNRLPSIFVSPRVTWVPAWSEERAQEEHLHRRATPQGWECLEALGKEVGSRLRRGGRWGERLRAGSDPGVAQAGAQHPQQADPWHAGEADEAGDRAKYQHGGEAQRSHQPHLWEGHCRTQLLLHLCQHMPRPYEGESSICVCLQVLCRMERSYAHGKHGKVMEFEDSVFQALKSYGSNTCWNTFGNVMTIFFPSFFPFSFRAVSINTLTLVINLKTLKRELKNNNTN